MALPAVHWKRFSGTLGPGATVTLTHGIRTPQYPTGVIPDAVHPDMSSGTYTDDANRRIGEYQARTAANVYLSNFDGTATHYYGVICRAYHTLDGKNL